MQMNANIRWSTAKQRIKILCGKPLHSFNVCSLNAFVYELSYEGRSQKKKTKKNKKKKLMAEVISMKNSWLRNSVHGWVLFLGIKIVYDDYKQ